MSIEKTAQEQTPPEPAASATPAVTVKKPAVSQGVQQNSPKNVPENAAKDTPEKDGPDNQQPSTQPKTKTSDPQNQEPDKNEGQSAANVNTARANAVSAKPKGTDRFIISRDDYNGFLAVLRGNEHVQSLLGAFGQFFTEENGEEAIFNDFASKLNSAMFNGHEAFTGSADQLRRIAGRVINEMLDDTGIRIPNEESKQNFIDGLAQALQDGITVRGVSGSALRNMFNNVGAVIAIQTKPLPKMTKADVPVSFDEPQFGMGADGSFIIYGQNGQQIPIEGGLRVLTLGDDGNLSKKAAFNDLKNIENRLKDGFTVEPQYQMVKTKAGTEQEKLTNYLIQTKGPDGSVGDSFYVSASNIGKAVSLNANVKADPKAGAAQSYAQPLSNMPKTYSAKDDPIVQNDKELAGTYISYNENGFEIDLKKIQDQYEVQVPLKPAEASEEKWWEKALNSLPSMQPKF